MCVDTDEKIHTIKQKNALMLKLCSLHTIWYNSDIFRFILIIFRELKNISKTYIKHGQIITLIKSLYVKCL